MKLNHAWHHLRILYAMAVSLHDFCDVQCQMPSCAVGVWTTKGLSGHKQYVTPTSVSLIDRCVQLQQPYSVPNGLGCAGQVTHRRRRRRGTAAHCGAETTAAFVHVHTLMIQSDRHDTRNIAAS